MPTILNISSTLVRQVTTSSTVLLQLHHKDGSPIPDVKHPDYNFRVHFFLSNTDVRLSGLGTIHEDIVVMLNKETWQNDGLQYNETKSINVNVQFSIPQDYCLYATFICVNVTAGHSASYIEIDSTNNIACHGSSSHILCQPGMY